MNRKAISALEYPKIIDLLSQKATSVPGKAACRSLQPSTDLRRIDTMQMQTSHALARLFKKGGVSFGSVKDIRGSLKRLDVGSSLSVTELLDICSLLENTGRVKAYGRPERDDAEPDCLTALFGSLEPLFPLSSEIRRCILSAEEVSDDASPGLRHVRRELKNANDRVHTQLHDILNGGARPYLQDSVVTMRNGRYCLPVKAEYKNQVSGMVHDQSSKGATLFIEPMAIIKLNNQIRELEIREQQEIEAVLATLSGLAAADREIIEADLQLMTELDFIFARASLAMEQNATAPIYNQEGRILLRKARHPLIPRKQVIPIDIRLGDEFDLLVVTGPNTGGKTVSMKTVGLLTLMGQAGLHIPAADRSELSVFEEVYADIGDEQSIEQNLSTFSSHMTNVVSFIEKADERSLVLFDELGAGTDPTEGAALAIAILSHLHGRGIRTMATTHYSELKVYALGTPGVENASCEFDVETLRPTYRLLIGVPGKSNAFAISSKLGLPDFLIEKARQQISQKDESLEDVISELESNRIAMEKEKDDIRQYKLQVSQLKAQLEKKQGRMDQQREKILQDAREEASKILQDAKDFADQSIKMYHKFQKDHIDLAAVEKERQRLRKKMDQLEGQAAPKTPSQPRKELKPKDLRVGDGVRVLSMGLNGIVTSLPDGKGNLFVQMGILRSQVSLSDLELLDEPVITGPTVSRTSTGKMKVSKSASAQMEIQLLGKTVDEAIQELDKFLDDACLAHLPQVRIVHGKGTGALRKGVHNYLKRQKCVKSFRLGSLGEGDSGVTIVEFK